MVMAIAAGRAIWVFAATILLSGCGTTMNLLGYKHGPVDLTPRLSPEALPYGGVMLDAGFLAWGGITYVNNRTPPTLREAAMGSLLLLDLPLSFIGDTLTLPFTLYTMSIRMA